MIEGKDVKLYYLKQLRAVILSTKIKHSIHIICRIV